MIGLKEGQNEITIRASGKILAPSLLCEDLETYELKGKSVALDYYLNGSELKIDLISNGVHTDLYVEKDHLFLVSLKKTG